MFCALVHLQMITGCTFLITLSAKKMTKCWLITLRKEFPIYKVLFVSRVCFRVPRLKHTTFTLSVSSLCKQIEECFVFNLWDPISIEYQILRTGSLLVVHWLILSPPHPNSPRRHTFLHFTFYISHEQDKTEICFKLKCTQYCNVWNVHKQY